MIYLLIALQLADCITTYIALQGANHEANAFLAKLFAKVGLVPGLLLTKLPLIAIVWFGKDLIHPYVFIALCVLYLWVVVNNVKVILKG